jgi:hypothetical protein
MKKLLSILTALFLLSQTLFSQDIIKFKNGNMRKVFVLTTSETEMTCRDFETKEIFSILKELVDSIEYEDGKTEPLGIALPQFVTYRKGILSYKGMDYFRPKTMRAILLKDSNTEITDQFNAYRTKRTFSSLFQFVGGFSLGWVIGSAVGGEGIDGKILTGSVSSFILSSILNKASNKNLKSAIGIYNDNLSSNHISFQPIIYQDSNFQTNIGFVMKF